MKRFASVTSVAYHLPETILTNEDLVREYPDWTVEKIFDKTGIRQRHVAAEGETALDLGEKAARKLLERSACPPDQIDALLLCTQTPDYALPPTACILQARLGLPTTVAAFDFNLGCSGFVYGLSIAKGLIETGQAKKCLLVTAETYSKWLDANDWSVRTIFGDGAAAALVERIDCPDEREPIGPFVFGTDGSGFKRLIVHSSGARGIGEAKGSLPEGRRPDRLFMDGAEIFAFTTRSVPQAVNALLAKAGMTLEQVDLFVFHQANAYMLEHLRKRLKIPQEKFVLAMAECGNTVSASIPIALKDSLDAGVLKPGMRIALVGFGVGYSWAAAILTWPGPGVPS
ncbi:MAG: ketoacyl-ACP synthase III [Planctomycetota bacterium]|nr:ketoacyl-ACP synthase III [Planctomycetota bacterium]